jgi:hypothetical protein
MFIKKQSSPFFTHISYAHAHLSMPRNISPRAGLCQHHLCQQSRLRSPGAYLKSTYCAVRRDSVNNFVSTSTV